MLFIILALTTGTVPDGYNIAKTQYGLASVYWPGDGHSGKTCADGKPFTKERCHIAHRISRTWALGRKVRVCSLTTKKCTVSFIGDAGPFGACDHLGIATKAHKRNGRLIYKHQCIGKWSIKIYKKDPGTWRGIADLSKCVWKKIGGPGMQRIRLDLLKRDRAHNAVVAAAARRDTTSSTQGTPGIKTRRLRVRRQALTA